MLTMSVSTAGARVVIDSYYKITACEIRHYQNWASSNASSFKPVYKRLNSHSK